MPQSSKSRSVRRRRLTPESLEPRLMMAVFPVTSREILDTYGQYQNRPPAMGAVADRLIHLHEGLDIVTDANAPVISIMRGRVRALWTDPNTPSDSFLVLQDLDPDGRPLDSGWNYKHVIPAAGLQVGSRVAEGAPLGTVARVAGLPAHLHIDRGDNALANVADPTLAPVVDKLSKSRLESARDKAVQLGRQLPPRWNPLLELSQYVTDTVAPTIESLSFRLAADDELGARPGFNDETFGQKGEIPRASSRYFRNKLLVGDAAIPHIGRYAPAEAANKRTSPAGTPGNSNIDFVVSAYDRTGTANAPVQFRLNPVRFGFHIQRLSIPGAKSNPAWPAESFYSFDFTASPGWATQGIADFYNVDNTRAVYENDSTHNSSFVTLDGDRPIDSARLYYILTNSPNVNQDFNRPLAPQIQRGNFHKDDRLLAWNSAAADGEEFSSGEGSNAKSNADAAYPDDIYTITVWAQDAHGNVGRDEFPVVLTNWKRTITSDKAKYALRENVIVKGGDGYRANQYVQLHVIPAPRNATTPAARTNLKNSLSSTYAKTNDQGELKPFNAEHISLGNKLPGGRHFLVADYNGDGQYTPELDAFTVIEVQRLWRPRFQLGGRTSADVPVDQSVNSIDESVEMIDESVEVVHESVELVDGSVEMIDESMELLDESMELIDESVELVDESVDLVDHDALWLLADLAAVWEGDADSTAEIGAESLEFAEPNFAAVSTVFTEPDDLDPHELESLSLPSDWLPAGELIPIELSTERSNEQGIELRDDQSSELSASPELELELVDELLGRRSEQNGVV